MISIFYDLETTDIYRVGQIINFAFIAVDDDFNVLETFHDNVRISRLQLPSVGAILANKTNVLKHQKTSKLSEREAVYRINEFLNKYARLGNGEKVALVGYNSASFDLNFLRTVFIRNGISPYNNQIINKDLLLVVRFLMGTNEKFSKTLFDYYADKKPNVKLETLYKAFNISKEKQAHESLFDVKLTMELARHIQINFDVDVRTFEPYQIKNLHNKEKGSVFYLSQPLPNITSNEKKVSTFPATLLEASDKYSLWIDLTKYSDEKNKKKSNYKEAIRRNKYADNVIYLADDEIEDSLNDLAKEALETLKEVNLENYYSDKTDNCYLEQFIYRFPLTELKLLLNAINSKKLPENLSAEGKTLFKRCWLENYQGETSEEYNSALKSYALFRYGGKMALDNYDEDESEEKKKKKFHPTLKEMFAQLKDRLSKAENIEDKKLIEALEGFYLESEIYKVMGDEEN